MDLLHALAAEVWRVEQAPPPPHGGVVRRDGNPAFVDEEAEEGCVSAGDGERERGSTTPRYGAEGVGGKIQEEVADVGEVRVAAVDGGGEGVGEGGCRLRIGRGRGGR